MSTSIEISESLLAQLKQSASLENHSLVRQAEHWMQLGRACEQRPDLAFSKVELALNALISPDALNDNEQETYFDRLEKYYLEHSGGHDPSFDGERPDAV